MIIFIHNTTYIGIRRFSYYYYFSSSSSPSHSRNKPSWINNKIVRSTVVYNNNNIMCSRKSVARPERHARVINALIMRDYECTAATSFSVIHKHTHTLPVDNYFSSNQVSYIRKKFVHCSTVQSTEQQSNTPCGYVLTTRHHGGTYTVNIVAV